MRLKHLEEENRRLKQMYRSGAPCRPELREPGHQGGTAKKVNGPAVRRQVAHQLVEGGLSRRQACRVVGLARNSYRQTTLKRYRNGGP